MKKNRFELFFSNLFDSKKIINSRLQIFTRFVIEALILNNDGDIFKDVIARLKAAYTVYFGNYETKNLNIAQRMGATKSLNDVTALFADSVRTKYNLIASVYPEGSEEYIAFFPFGLSEFSKLTRGNVLVVSNRIAICAKNYEAKLGGTTFSALFANLDKQIEDAINEQTKRKTKVAKVSGDVINSRHPIEDELMKVLYLIGATFWPDLVKCNSFFDFSLLFGSNHSNAIVNEGSVEAKSTALCIDVNIVPQSIFTLRNVSDLPQTYFATHYLGGAAVGIPILVPPQSEHVAPFTEFGATDMLYLYVKNDTDFKGDWEVRMD